MRPGRLVTPVLPTAGLLLLGRLGGAGWDVPVDSVAAFTHWAGTMAPVPLAMALVRLAAQVICGYLLLATVLPLLADALGYRWLHVLATRAVPAVLRRTLTGSAGLGLAAGSILWTNTSPAGAGLRPTVELVGRNEEPSARPTATMTLLQPAPAEATAVEVVARDEPSARTTATITLLQPAPPDATAVELIARDEEPAVRTTATMVLLESGPSGATTAMTLLEPAPSEATATMRLLEPPPDPAPEPAATGDRPPTTVAGSAAPGSPAAATPGGTSRLASALEPLPKVTEPGAMEDETWVVESGDSFWSIAEDVVGTGAATDAYWQQLIAANRDRLAVPDQPDLLFPGQILTLPRPTSPEVS